MNSLSHAVIVPADTLAEMKEALTRLGPLQELALDVARMRQAQDFALTHQDAPQRWSKARHLERLVDQHLSKIFPGQRSLFDTPPEEPA